EELWAAAAEAQQARMVVSPFEERATELVGDASGYIAKEDLWVALGRPDAATRTQKEMNELTAVMKNLGWKSNPKRRGGSDPIPTYEKLVMGLQPEWLVQYGGKFISETRRVILLHGGNS